LKAACLNSATRLDDHTAQLNDLLTGRGPDPARGRAFVEAFVRPQGLSRPSTPIFVDAVEQLARLRVASPAAEAAAPTLSLRLLAAFERGAGHVLMLDERERSRPIAAASAPSGKRRTAGRGLAAKADVRAEKARRFEERQRLKQQKRRIG